MELILVKLCAQEKEDLIWGRFYRQNLGMLPSKTGFLWFQGDPVLKYVSDQRKLKKNPALKKEHRIRNNSKSKVIQYIYAAIHICGYLFRKTFPSNATLLTLFTCLEFCTKSQSLSCLRDLQPGIKVVPFFPKILRPQLKIYM